MNVLFLALIMVFSTGCPSLPEPVSFTYQERETLVLRRCVAVITTDEQGKVWIVVPETEEREVDYNFYAKCNLFDMVRGQNLDDGEEVYLAEGDRLVWFSPMGAQALTEYLQEHVQVKEIE